MAVNKELKLNEAEEKMRHLLWLAVEERISGKENLGVYLSGGLDSFAAGRPLDEDKLTFRFPGLVLFLPGPRRLSESRRRL